jgi:RNA polymerase sigma-70 factor (ECF subfamily)
MHMTVRVLPDSAVRDDSDFLERERLDKAFARLSPEHRAVVVLYYYRDLAAAEIARALGIPVGTVNSRLHYGTRALRAELDAGERPKAGGVAGTSA